MRKKYHVAAMMLTAAMLITACGEYAGTGAENMADVAGIASSTSTETGQSTDSQNGNSLVNTAADPSELFSQRDLSGAYDEAGCNNITLSDDGCKTDSRNVAIGKNGNTDTITITGEGDYLVSGSLGNGMIIIDVDKTEKVQLICNGVNIRSASSAAVYVKNADKVFLTLAGGTENEFANGGAFVAIDDNNIDAAVFSKDDLTLNGTGALVVSSPAGHGIVSKNELTITGGIFTISALSHGLTGKDSIAIADGTFRITAGEDAIKSVNKDDVTKGSVYIFGGNYQLSAASDGINALNEINISGGKITVEKSNEGLEARVIHISGGETDITSSDDGLNATDKRAEVTAQTTAGGTTSAAAENGMRFGKGKGGGENMDEASIQISGGILRVNAEGDGLDSNGHLLVSGGETYVEGASNSGDAALDYGIDAVINGGTVLAIGQSGMAQNFGGDSAQGAILINTEQINAAGSDAALLDKDGNKLIAWTAKKSYNSIVVSCPEIKDGETYTVRTGGTDTNVTMDGLIYGQGGGFGGHGGGMGGFKNRTKPEGAPGQQRGPNPQDMPGQQGMPDPRGDTMPEGKPGVPDGAEPEKGTDPSGETTEGVNIL